MKKSVLFTVMVAVFLFFNAQAHAARALDLSGNEYNVYILCSEDLGDFCDQGRTQTDTFIFDGDNFGIESLEDDFGGFLGNGEFSASGLSFDAHYEAIDGFNSYEFDIKGLNLIDIILFGTMDITYSEYEFPLGTEDTEGKAFFIGIKN
ncbi:MAG: hypothetical protein JW832_17495 [Deltaproteobacteria bacterium]|nr:hypothetical protein [Deltaproteobacteria bacterium]